MASRSEQIDAVAKAIVLAQADIEKADKDAKGNFGRYTTLRSVWDACKPALQKQGLAVLQFSEPSEAGTLALTTMLLHTSGQFISGTETIPLGAKHDPQSYGSALTYARRYGLAAMVGVCPEDDDASAATQKTPRSAPTAQQSPAPLRQQAPSAGGYGSVKAGAASDIARRWFFARLKEDYGLTPDQAKALLGIQSYSQDMPDKTFAEILHFIKMEQLRQQKAAAAAN